MLRAKRLVVVGLVAVICGVGAARPAQAGECFDQLTKDITACLNVRDQCINTTSWWTRTCNLEYLVCSTGAEYAYADCNLSAIGAVLGALMQ